MIEEFIVLSRSHIRSLVAGSCVFAFNLILAGGTYESIGWHDIRGYRDVTYGLVIVPILLLSLANFVVGLVLIRSTLGRTSKNPLNLHRSGSAPAAIPASFLASAAIVALSPLVVPILGPALNHGHLLHTPLTVAAAYQDDTLVISKVLAGENPNVKTPGRGGTPLHYMAGGNKPAAVKVLLENGAKPNEPDPTGKTPLHWAVGGRVDPTILRLLLEAGASPFAKDHKGKTPIDYTETLPPPLGPEFRRILVIAAKMPTLLEPVGESPKEPVSQRK